MTENTQSEQGRQKVRTGKVVSSKMNKTIVVLIETLIQHPIIKKYIRGHKKYYAHDETNDCRIGDTVRITECRPLSKLKRWRVTEIVERAK